MVLPFAMISKGLFKLRGAKLAEDVAKLPYLHTLQGDSQNKGVW